MARHAKTAGHPRLRAPQEESPYWYKHETTNEPTCKACGRSFTRGHVSSAQYREIKLLTPGLLQDAKIHFQTQHLREAERIEAQLEIDGVADPSSHPQEAIVGPPTIDDHLMSTLREDPSVTKGSRKYKYHKGDDELWYCDERCNRSFGSASVSLSSFRNTFANLRTW